METFINAATSVTISATETRILDFILTTGTGGTPPQIAADSISVQLFTGPNVFNLRSIDTRTFIQSPAIVNKIPQDKQSAADYWSSMVVRSGLSSAPPWGTKGTRLYVSEEQEGPYSLCNIALIGPEQLLQFYPLVPEKTYYFRLSIFGTWGEVELTDEPVQIKTPKPLVLLTPQNDEQISEESIEFSWEHIWESFDSDYFYLISVFNDNLESIYNYQTQEASHTYLSLNLPYGKEYYWFVYTQANEEIEEDGKSISKEHISISYLRRFKIPYQPGNNLVRNGDFSSGELLPWYHFEESGFSDDPPSDYEWQVSAQAYELHWYRKNSYGAGGSVGVYQDLGNFDTTGATKVYLEFDVQINEQIFNSNQYGYHPAQVHIIFTDQNENELVYIVGFLLEGSDDTQYEPPENVKYVVRKIHQNSWEHFENDLMQDSQTRAKVQEYSYIKEIRFFGSGWDFEARVDNIRLTIEW